MDFVEGSHHRIIAELFDEVVAGRKKRIIINMPPRHTKSEFASIYLPAFFLGNYPNKKVIQSSHTAELAVGFGRKVRALIDRDDFQELFPSVALSADNKAAGRWSTNRGGEYFAIGAEGAIAGKGADLFIIDDPHTEQDAVIGETNPEVYNRVMSWYEGGPRQRLQPGGGDHRGHDPVVAPGFDRPATEEADGRFPLRSVGDRAVASDPAFRQPDLAGILAAWRN